MPLKKISAFTIHIEIANMPQKRVSSTFSGSLRSFGWHGNLHKCKFCPQPTLGLGRLEISAEENAQCPICKLAGQKVSVSDYGERLQVNCARCGRFKITRTAKSTAESRLLESRLSAWFRDRTESGVQIPEINSNTLDDIEKILPDYGASDKQNILLRRLERRSRFPGQRLDIGPDVDYPLAWATNQDEFRFYIRALIQRGLLEGLAGNFDTGQSVQVQITPKGWDYLAQHERAPLLSNQAFIAMTFSPELKPAWENAIRPAVKRAGFKPFRVDAEPHAERIDVKIITEIKNSRFVVADVTKQRPGVYFEAGYNWFRSHSHLVSKT